MKGLINVYRKVGCLFILLLGLLLNGCVETTAPVAVTSVTLDSTSMTLVEGESQTLTATISPSNAENHMVLWSSSNSSIATVREGVVSAIKPGTAIITVKSDDGGKIATCEVTVIAKLYPVESVSLDKTSCEITEGDEVVLTAIIKPNNATNKNVVWSSSYPSVATVSNGNVIALSAGKTTIVVTTDDGGKAASCEVTVNALYQPVESISLNMSSIDLSIGDEITLVATVHPNDATNKDISWKSSEESIVSVENGKVRANALGEAIITATSDDGEKTASCTVHVIIPVVSINIQQSLELYQSDVITLEAKVLPADATYREIVWSVDDSSIVQIDQNGVVTAIKEGWTTIKASAGGVSGLCYVYVLKRGVAERDYVDEYGINHGKGISIGSTVWAPVNCGYLAPTSETEGYVYGKLYQWGRKYGQGYSGEFYDSNGVKTDAGISDQNAPTIEEGPVSTYTGESISNENIFYKGGDWAYPHNKDLWNPGTKTEYDPCPEGWRVPSKSELNELNGHWSDLVSNDQGLWGRYLSGPNPYSEEVAKIFLPAAGYRSSNGTALGRGKKSYYWSSVSYTYETSNIYTAYYMYGLSIENYNNRGNAYSVRCVQE